MTDYDNPEPSLYSERDMVDVVDADGNAIEFLPQVPKAWLESKNAYLLPPGTKKGKPKSDSGSGSSSSGTGSGGTASTRKPGEEPPRSGTGSGIKEWEAYAREKGAKDEDLLDETAEPLTREALIDKYGTKPS